MIHTNNTNRYNFVAVGGGTVVCVDPESPRFRQLYTAHAGHACVGHAKQSYYTLMPLGSQMPEAEMAGIRVQLEKAEYQHGTDALCDCPGCLATQKATAQ